MKLQVVLSEVSFNSPAHYFIKLELTHDSHAQDSKSFQRTPVSTVSSKTPQFAQTSFHFELPPNHPLVNPKASEIKKSVLKLTACLIKEETTPPSTAVSGTVGVIVFPNEPLKRGILDMQIVYFHNESKAEIGKCIVTLSVTKSADGISEKHRLDPVDSFLNMHQPLSKAKPQLPDKILIPVSSFGEKSPTSMPSNASEKVVPPSSSFLEKVPLFKAKSPEAAASPPASVHEKVPPIIKINSETSEDYSIRSNPDLLQVIAESYSPPKAKRKDSIDNERPDKEMLYDEHDVDQRQRLIDKLLEELDHRTDAVKKVGQDLYRLREKNAENEAIILKLSNKLEESERVNSKILNTIDLDMLSVEELRKRYAMLAARLQASLAKSEELSEMLEGAQEKVIERNEIEKQLLEIQQAHTSQQVYVQRLQDKLSDISRYRSTIKIQEQIIRKFESLLNEASQAQEQTIQEQMRERERMKERDIPKVQETTVQMIPPETVANQNALVASLERENKMLLSKIHDLEFSLEKAQLVSAIVPPVPAKDDTLELFKMELEAERDALLQLEPLQTKKKDSDECSDFALLLRAEKAEARVVALEQELEESAVEFTQKVTELEAEIRELQKSCI